MITFRTFGGYRYFIEGDYNTLKAIRQSMAIFDSTIKKKKIFNPMLNEWVYPFSLVQGAVNSIITKQQLKMVVDTCDKLGIKYVMPLHYISESLQPHASSIVGLYLDQIAAYEAMCLNNCGIINAATNYGKSYVFLAYARTIIKENKKLLIMVYTDKLFKQTLALLQGDMGVNNVGYVDSNGKFRLDTPIIVAKTLSMQNIFRQKKLNGISFDTIIIDECHRASAASYDFMFRKINFNFIFGMSGTPFKNGTHQLQMHKRFGDVIYHNTSVQNELIGRSRNTNYFFVNNRIKRGHTIYDCPERIRITKEIVASRRDTDILITCDRISHIENIFEAIKDMGLNIILAHTKLTNELEIMNDNQVKGIPMVVICTTILLEGLNIKNGFPTMIYACGGSSTVRIHQFAGRAKRLDNEMEGTKNLDIFEFEDTGNSNARANSLARQADIKNSGYVINKINL